MSNFSPEPTYAHGTPERTGVLYVNLGTPDAPTPAAVRRYLAEFLGDPRVVEIPRLLWLAILHGVILRTRPAKSAAKYASIWTAEGSPLKVWTEKQAKLLQGWLAQRGCDVPVRWAMRYGSTSVASQLDAFKAQGVSRVLVLPAYPQYSATTSASVFDAVYQWAARTRRIPELRFVNQYHDDTGYIAALAAAVQRHWQNNGRPEVLVMSFHGVPERTLLLGDPYHCQCQKTARLLAQALGLPSSHYKVTFQSRLGRAKWLQPYTEPALIAMARAGVKRVDVICPAFVSDCLETLEEINQEAREAFLHAGGQQFNYIACLNDDPAWITALCQISQQHLQGWPTQATPDAAQAEASRLAALALGAAR
jgi:ferrochelatase